MSRRLTPLLLPVLTVAALLAGCGGSSDNGIATKTPIEILGATKAVATNASSVYLSSTASARSSSFSLQAVLSKSASRARVALLSSTFEAIRSGEKLYVRGNHAFTAGLSVAVGAKIPPNTWIEGPTNGPLRETAAFTNISTEVPLILNGPGSLAKGTTTTVADQPAIEVKQNRALSTTTIYVATTGEPYPLLMRKTGRENGQTTFTNWNKPVHVDPPANTVELSQLPKTDG